MGNFHFSTRSLRNLSGVHPNLIAVVGLALSQSVVDFTVVEGLRDIETQRQNVAKGVSQTMNSRHLKQDDGFGHAVDLYPYFDGSVQVEAPEEAFKGHRLRHAVSRRHARHPHHVGGLLEVFRRYAALSV